MIHSMFGANNEMYVMTDNDHGYSRHEDGHENNELCTKVFENIRDLWPENSCSNECFLSIETRNIDLDDKLVTTTVQCMTVQVCHLMLLCVCVCVS